MGLRDADMVDIVEIVHGVDIVDIVGIVDIVDCWLLKLSGTMLSSIEAISMWINQLISIMGLRGASAKKNQKFENN